MNLLKGAGNIDFTYCYIRAQISKFEEWKGGTFILIKTLRPQYIFRFLVFSLSCLHSDCLFIDPFVATSPFSFINRPLYAVPPFPSAYSLEY